MIINLYKEGFWILISNYLIGIENVISIVEIAAFIDYPICAQWILIISKYLLLGCK